MVRAFLAFNRAYEITLHPSYLLSFNPEWFASHMPLCLKDTGGSLWLRRVE
jgi:hypothetical protein